MFCHIAYLNYFYTFSLEVCNYCHLGTGIFIRHSVRCHLSFLLFLLIDISHLYIYWKKILSSCKDIYSLISLKYALIAFSKKKKGIEMILFLYICKDAQLFKMLRTFLYTNILLFLFKQNKRGRVFLY